MSRHGGLMNVPSLSFYPTLGPPSRDGRHDSCADRCCLSSLWMALELALTLRTLTVHLACGWSSVGYNRWVRRAVRFTVDVGTARIVLWRRLPPQLHFVRQCSLPQTKWTTHGSMVYIGFVAARA